jgi:hypothetical protein
MENEKQEQINALFQYNNHVKINYGFYKDRTGYIKSVFTKRITTKINNKISETVTNWYNIEILQNDRKLFLELSEEHLELVKKFKPFPFNLIK